ncbi:hypothetical protein Vretimale_15432 [Volvox reticuliferus]|uniref:Uncharacterized protein n=1 Tax=Volvox reticuliferus TaxID=1737510 RepID=A0A8J4GRR5_9CHLO|nr:hypothetical protein Vretifemale_20481 [Volvox reticuliferus]GIM12047.1 hypothetical protein Vretimale_15432 [Volvox reticuliferus]
MTTRVPETATAAPADDNSTSPSLPWLLERRQWTQALHVARARVSSDPWDIAAWWGLARALMEGLMEPEAAYTACCRALQALENRPQPSQPPQPPGRYGRRVDMPSPQQLAELRFECLSAVARGDSNSVRARWNRHLHPALRLQVLY